MDISTSKLTVLDQIASSDKVRRKIINEGMERGVFKKVDVDLMAYNIIIMAHMYILKRWHFKNRLSLEEYTNLQLTMIMDALIRS